MTKRIPLDAHPDQTGPSFELVTVTPTIAEEWLGRNEGNRNKKQEKIERYSRDMVAGTWEITGEAIKFDWDGRLIDGQNRLEAVKLAGRPVAFLVARGLDPNSQKVMDTGAKRSAGDALKMSGERSNPGVMAATIRLALGAETGRLVSSASYLPEVSNSEVISWYEKNPDMIHACALGVRVAKHIGAGPSALAYCIFVTSRVDATASFQFFDDLANMRTNGKGDPRYTLLKRLQRVRETDETARSPQIVYYVLRSWNAWRAGESLHGLKDSVVGTATKIPEPR